MSQTVICPLDYHECPLKICRTRVPWYDLCAGGATITTATDSRLPKDVREQVAESAIKLGLSPETIVGEMVLARRIGKIGKESGS